MVAGRGISELYEEKMKAALDRDTDPREIGKFSLAQLLDLLAEIGLKDARIGLYHEQAKVQVDELDRETLARQATILEGPHGVRAQLDALGRHQARLQEADRRIRGKVTWFRDQQKGIIERHDLEGAHACTASTFASIQDDITDVDIAARLAEESIRELQARLGAL